MMIQRFFISFLLIFFAVSCQQDKPENRSETGQEKPVVVSVNYPLHFFVEQIAAGHVEAVFDVPAGKDPAYWKPSEQDILIIQKAELILINGADYAKWLDKISLPASRLVNTSSAFEDKYVELDEGISHSHGPEGEHRHVGYASTTWLNFDFAIQQAEAVKEALAGLLPDAQIAFESNFEALQARLKKLDVAMQEIAGRLQGEVLYGSHPVYQYLSEGYGLTILSEHWEPDEDINLEQWQAFQKKHRENKGDIVLWEAEPLAEVRTKLEDAGIAVIVFDPCAKQPVSGDFFTQMQANIAALQGAVPTD